MTIVEVTISLVILSVALVTVGQLLALFGKQRGAADARRIALAEVANQAERAALLPWTEIAPGRFTAWQPSAELVAALPQARCTAEVTEEPAAPHGRRVRLVVAWTNSAGQPVTPAELCLWRFPPAESSEEKQP